MAAKRKLTLDDDTVVRMVEALNGYECRPTYNISTGSATLPALAPLIERYDAIKEAERATCRKEYANAHAKRDEREKRICASSIALLLGHPYPAIQGTSAECRTCGKSGGMHDTLIGALFSERCT